jgi:glycosyltransferase involved in cell wall biosynthesis
MAAGRPVVAYDLPVYRRHYGGILEAVPCFDFDAFANSVVALLKDPSRREVLGNKGYVRSTRYDWNVLARMDWDSVMR